MRFEVKYPTIPLSGTVSEIFNTRGMVGMSIFAPVITSCQVLLQGSFDQTSANFVRAQNSQGSGQWTYSAGVGSNCINAKDVGYFPFARLETTIAQAAVRSFAVVTNF